MDFTKASTDKFKAPAHVADHYEWDDAMPGFGIRTRNGGAKAWVVKYRIGDKQRKVGLGLVGKVSLADAKFEAGQMFAKVARKVDPVNERVKTSAEASQTFNPAFNAFVTKMETDGCSKSYVDATRAYFETHLKKLHGWPLATLDKETVGRVLDVITDERGPISSNRARAAGATFYNWAIKKFNGVDKNPFEMTDKNEETSRDRVLLTRETKAIWSKLEPDENDDDYSDIVKLLILTGARRNEIGSLRRAEVNLENKQLEIPGTYVDEFKIEQRRTKNGLPLILPLSPPAFKILTRRMKSMIGHNSGASQFVFGRYDGPFSGWSKAKKELCGRLKIDDWTLHDFRRTLATDTGEFCGVAPHVVEAILNHVSGDAKKGVAGTYNKAQYLDEKREALNKYGAWIMKAIA